MLPLSLSLIFKINPCSNGTRRLIARTCKVFRFARKLSAAPADLESRHRAPQRVGGRVKVRVRVRVRVRVGAGVGLVWAAQPSFCAELHIGEPPYINRY